LEIPEKINECKGKIIATLIYIYIYARAIIECVNYWINISLENLKTLKGMFEIKKNENEKKKLSFIS